jgi:hypothetical protein
MTLFREMIAVSTENHTKSINALRKQMQSYCILKQVTGGIYNTHCAVNGRTLVTDCGVDLIDLHASLETE